MNGFNGGLRGTALNMLLDRIKKIDQFFSISQMFEVPLQKTEFAITQIPMQRKDCQGDGVIDNNFASILDSAN